jgi:hypothetical protein
MRARELVLREALRVHEGDRERVAQRQRCGRAGGRGEIQRTGFLLGARIEVDVGLFGESGPTVARERDELRALALEQRHDREDLRAFAGIRKPDEDVAARDHAEVTVARLGRVHEKSGSAGARERGRDLARDMPGLAHAADDHAPPTLKYDAHGFAEALVEAGDQVRDGLGFDLEHVAGDRDRAVVVRPGNGLNHVRASIAEQPLRPA